MKCKTPQRCFSGMRCETLHNNGVWCFDYTWRAVRLGDRVRFTSDSLSSARHATQRVAQLLATFVIFEVGELLATSAKLEVRRKIKTDVRRFLSNLPRTGHQRSKAQSSQNLCFMACRESVYQREEDGCGTCSREGCNCRRQLIVAD